MKILNLSNHTLTEQQMIELQEKGYEVIELDQEDKTAWGQLTPFNYKEITDRIFSKYDVDCFHTAGFPAGVNYAVDKARKLNKISLYSYSVRNCSEKKQGGVVLKNYIFKHEGFFEY